MGCQGNGAGKGGVENGRGRSGGFCCVNEWGKNNSPGVCRASCYRQTLMFVVFACNNTSFGGRRTNIYLDVPRSSPSALWRCQNQRSIGHEDSSP